MKHGTTLHFIDNSSRSRANLARTGFALGYHAEVYSCVSEFCSRPPNRGIIICQDGERQSTVITLVTRLAECGIWLPIIAITESPTPARIIAVIKAGALDYLPLPLEKTRFAATLERVIEEAAISGEMRRRVLDARNRIAHLSIREREVLDWMAEGSSNKAIARELDISPRTVEIHRANMIVKLGAKHSAEAVRLRVEAQIRPKLH